MKAYENSELNVREKLARNGYKRVHSEAPDGQYTVALFQHKSRKRYAVAYGLQYESGLDYVQAAKDYGLCLMHALCCAGELECEE
jgi:hypothetical protein